MARRDDTADAVSSSHRTCRSEVGKVEPGREASRRRALAVWHPSGRSLWGPKTTFPTSADRVRWLGVMTRPMRSHRAIERVDSRSIGRTGMRSVARSRWCKLGACRRLPGGAENDILGYSRDSWVPWSHPGSTLEQRGSRLIYGNPSIGFLKGCREIGSLALGWGESATCDAEGQGVRGELGVTPAGSGGGERGPRCRGR